MFYLDANEQSPAVFIKLLGGRPRHADLEAHHVVTAIHVDRFPCNS
jgi:hypothetical protein